MALRLAFGVLLALAVVGCGRAAPKPAEAAVRTVTKVEVVEVPVAAEKPAAPELLEPLDVDFPELLERGQGDYCMTRASAGAYLRMLSAMRSYRQLCVGAAAPAELEAQ